MGWNFIEKNLKRKDNLVTETKVVKTKKSSFIWKTSFYKKMASDLHRTAQPHTFAMFPSWRILQELVV